MAGRFEKPGGPPTLLGPLLLLLAALLAAGGVFAAVHFSGRNSAGKADEPEEADAQLSEQLPQEEPEESESALPEEPVRVEEPVTVTLMAVGDNLIHNCVYWSAETDGGYDFRRFYRGIAEDIESHDIACINQETILVDDAADISSYPTFGTPAAMASSLASVGFDVVTHATNHTLDKGTGAIDETLAAWAAYPEVAVLGIHADDEAASELCVIERSGIRIALLNYTYGVNSGLGYESWRIDTFGSFEKFGADIARGHELADLVIVFAHWGEDGNTAVTSTQRSWAQRLADYGADLIIGTHPHVVQPLEYLTGANGEEVPVFWSLGNFLSHQVQVVELLEAMADVTITKDAEGVRISACALRPLVNAYWRSDSWYDYCPMHLEEFGEYYESIEAIDGCTADALWSLWESATGQSRPS